MRFQPEVGSKIQLEDRGYAFSKHPSARELPYGQEGRVATVFHLSSVSEPRHQLALKVFKRRYRQRSLVNQARSLRQYSTLEGLTVCERQVLDPESHEELLKQHPDLKYAIVMPWIEGPTWCDCIQGRVPLTEQQSFDLARALVSTLELLARNQIAHCDLSGPNLIISNLGSADDELAVELVDVEALFSPDLPRPETIPEGTPGYGHRSTSSEVWGPHADRFSGAVLLGEILGWCSPELVQSSSDESYFSPEEIQRDSPRYRRLLETLSKHWGPALAELFEKAWQSPTPAGCPSFQEWSRCLSRLLGAGDDDVTEELHDALELESKGDLMGAIALYQSIEQRLKDSHLKHEVHLVVVELQRLLKNVKAPPGDDIQHATANPAPVIMLVIAFAFVVLLDFVEDVARFSSVFLLPIAVTLLVDFERRFPGAAANRNEGRPARGFELSDGFLEWLTLSLLPFLSIGVVVCFPSENLLGRYLLVYLLFLSSTYVIAHLIRSRTGQQPRHPSPMLEPRDNPEIASENKRMSTRTKVEILCGVATVSVMALNVHDGGGEPQGILLIAFSLFLGLWSLWDWNRRVKARKIPQNRERTGNEVPLTFKRTEKQGIVVAVSLFCLFALILLFRQSSAESVELLEACRQNIREIARASAAYSKNEFYYPRDLGQLIPDYLSRIPSCPVGGTYGYSYTVGGAGDYPTCTIYCRGLNHVGAGLNREDHPKYSIDYYGGAGFAPTSGIEH